MDMKERYREAFSGVKPQRDYLWICHRENQPAVRKKAVTGQVRRVAVAASICLLVFPATVFAAQKIWSFYEVHTQQSKLDHTINVKQKENPDEKIYVRLTYDMDKLSPYELEIPAEDEGDRVEHNFSYQGKGKQQDSAKDFCVDLYHVKSDVTIEDINTEAAEKLVIAKHSAYYLEETTSGSEVEPYFDLYPKSMYVFYPEYGYYLKFAGMKNLDKNSLTRLAENFTLEQVPKKQADACLEASDMQDKLVYGDNLFGGDMTVYEKVLQYHKKADYHGVTVQIDKVDKIDSLEEADRYVSIPKLEKTDFEKYTRETVVHGNGKQAPLETVVEKQTAQPVLALIHLTIQNTTSEKQDIPANFGCIRNLVKKDGTYQYNDKSYNRDRDSKVILLETQFQPLYYKGIDRENGGWKQRLKPGEKRTVELAYLLDEDQLADTCLYVNGPVELDENGRSTDGIYLKIQ